MPAVTLPFPCCGISRAAPLQPAASADDGPATSHATSAPSTPTAISLTTLLIPPHCPWPQIPDVGRLGFYLAPKVEEEDGMQD